MIQLETIFGIQLTSVSSSGSVGNLPHFSLAITAILCATIALFGRTEVICGLISLTVVVCWTFVEMETEGLRVRQLVE